MLPVQKKRYISVSASTKKGIRAISQKKSTQPRRKHQLQVQPSAMNPSQLPVVIPRDGSSGDLAAASHSKPLVRWTVQHLGKVPPPASDDYTTWTVEQLRKECAARKLRVSRKTTRAEKIDSLEQNDAVRQSGAISTAAVVDKKQGAIANAITVEPGKRMTIDCTVRLLTILFSDAFCARIARSDASVTRQKIQREAYTAPLDSRFWQQVKSEFLTNVIDYNKVPGTPNPRLAPLKPWRILKHDTVTLYAAWKDVNERYTNALRGFATSGISEQDGKDFFEYCNGQVDTYYLRVCLHAKSKNTPMADGCTSQQKITVGSLKRSAADAFPQLDPPKAYRPCKIAAKVVSSGTNVILREDVSPTSIPVSSSVVDVDVDINLILDRLVKLHTLIDQIKTSLYKLETDGRSDRDLEASLMLYQRHVRQCERRLEASVS